MGATMPAVLVEVGFITNPSEEKKLRDPAHLKKVAEAIHRAIRSFGEERRRRAASRSAP
jgi:N-acetylmuramoyl-L-alanine amidase